MSSEHGGYNASSQHTVSHRAQSSCLPLCSKMLTRAEKKQIIGDEGTAKPRASPDQAGLLVVRPGSTQYVSQAGDVKRCTPSGCNGRLDLKLKQHSQPRNGRSDLSCPFEQTTGVGPDYNLQLAWYEQGGCSCLLSRSYGPRKPGNFASIVGAGARRTLEDARFIFGANVACNLLS